MEVISILILMTKVGKWTLVNGHPFWVKKPLLTFSVSSWNIIILRHNLRSNQSIYFPLLHVIGFFPKHFHTSPKSIANEIPSFKESVDRFTSVPGHFRGIFFKK
jgi:hypothetical protein